MYKKILLPVDLTQKSSKDKPLIVAAELARPSNAEVHVIAVVPDYGKSMVGSFFKENFEKDAIAQTKKELEDFLSKNAPSDLDVKGHVMHGTIYEEIIGAANRLECDLIIVASHRPELKDYLLGPNAARIVRHANQSVMVVRD